MNWDDEKRDRMTVCAILLFIAGYGKHEASGILECSEPSVRNLYARAARWLGDGDLRASFLTKAPR